MQPVSDLNTKNDCFEFSQRCHANAARITDNPIVAGRCQSEPFCPMPAATIPIRPAATVVVLRQQWRHIEVLLLRRNSELIFGGDHWVFPGGRIDDQDYITARSDSRDEAARVAAVREALEEASLRIQRQTLTPVSHWTTPAPSPKRYRTAFFVTTCESNQQVVVDGSEIVDHQWLHPAEAIEHYDSGAKKMMQPTIHTLHEIARHDHAADFIAMGAAREPIVFDD
jgi:8-oxo-dGTP pyrophosphatase MutT (NUDIX family)